MIDLDGARRLSLVLVVCSLLWVIFLGGVYSALNVPDTQTRYETGGEQLPIKARPWKTGDYKTKSTMESIEETEP